MHGIDQSDSFEAGQQKWKIEIMEVSAPEDDQVFLERKGAKGIRNKFPAGVEMGFPSGAAAVGAVADADLRRQQPTASSEPRARRRAPFKNLKNHQRSGSLEFFGDAKCLGLAVARLFPIVARPGAVHELVESWGGDGGINVIGFEDVEGGAAFARVTSPRD